MTKHHDPLADQPLGQKLIKKGFWLYFFTAIILPTGYLIRIVISQSLPVEEVGLLYTIIGFMGVLSGYNDLGLTGALVYYIPNLWIEKSKGKILGLISLASLAQITTTIAISLFLWFGGDWLAMNYFHNSDAAPLLRRFIWYFAGINIIQVIQVIFKSFQDVIREKSIEAVRLWSSLALAGRVFWFSGNPSVLGFGSARAYGMVVAVVVGLVLFVSRYARLLWAKPIWDKKLIRDFGGYAIYTFLAMNVGLLLWQADQQMVNFFLGNKEAGYYSNFLALTFMATMVLGPLSSFMYALFAELFAKNNQTSIRRIIELHYHELLMFLLSACMFLSVFGPEISLFLFGDERRFSGEILRWYVPFVFLGFVNGLHLSLLSSNGKAKINAWITFVGLVVNVMVNYFGMEVLGRGVWGAVAGLVVSNGTMCLMSFRKVREIISWDIHKDFWLKGIGVLGLTTFALIGVHSITLPLFWSLLSGGVSVLVVLGLFYWKKVGFLMSEMRGMRE